MISKQEKNIFLDDYTFYGNQKDMVVALTSVIDKDSQSKIFKINIDLFMCSAIVGCFYNKKAKPCKGGKGTKILSGQFTNHSDELDFILRLVLITGDKDKLEKSDRLNRAFRHKDEKENYDLFELYMLGGLEIIYNNFFNSNSIYYDQFLINLNNFMEKFKNEKDVNDDAKINEIISSADFF